MIQAAIDTHTHTHTYFKTKTEEKGNEVSLKRRRKVVK